VLGSPEVIESLVVPNSLPSWYAARHTALTKQGMRVIALASRRVPEAFSDRQLMDYSRAWAETGLSFVGFVAFRCLVRKDSRETVEDLQDSAHHVVMITGDAVLTGFFFSLFIYFYVK
jgi:magnesium-transporting ATPase (P-type)